MSTLSLILDVAILVTDVAIIVLLLRDRGSDHKS